ncbi:MAG: TetR/AcrR family transcriptional regulator, partial [Terriglobales bacterium]
ILAGGVSRCTVFCMPYPSKTDRQTILSAAVKELVQGGIRDLSLRNIAASLDLAPNAIYRYFSDRRALEAALANEAARQLELALRKAAHGREPVSAIRKMSSAYIRFARDNRHLYEVMMSLNAPGHDATSHRSLWAFTVEQVQRIAGSDRAPQASVALWAFLHGAVALEAAQVLGEIKPASGLEFGFEAWLMAVSTHREPIDAPRIEPTKKSTNKKVSARERSVRRGK